MMLSTLAIESIYNRQKNKADPDDALECCVSRRGKIDAVSAVDRGKNDSTFKQTLTFSLGHLMMSRDDMCSQERKARVNKQSELIFRHVRGVRMDWSSN